MNDEEKAELLEDFEILILAWLKSDNENITHIANSLVNEVDKRIAK